MNWKAPRIRPFVTSLSWGGVRLAISGDVEGDAFRVRTPDACVALATRRVSRDGRGPVAELVVDRHYSLGALRLGVRAEACGVTLVLETTAAAPEGRGKLMQRLGGDAALLRLIAPARTSTILRFDPSGTHTTPADEHGLN